MRHDLFLIEMGKRIRTIRKAKNMTLETMKDITGIARDNLSRIEAGKKNSYILSLKKIAECLEVNVKELF